MVKRLVVIGGVAAGMSAASRAKRYDPDLDVVVLERGPHVSYGSCGIPFFIAGMFPHVERLIVHDPRFFHDKRGITVHVEEEALRVDLAARSVRSRGVLDGHTRDWPFDELVICTGASPFKPDWLGIDSPNVFTVRTADDASRLKSYIEQSRPRQAAVIGAGLIGLEMAEALNALGMAVTVIKRPKGPLLNMFDEEMDELVRRETEKSGVSIRDIAGVAGLATGGSGLVGHVILDNGDEITVDLVILEMGYRPNSTLAAEAGLRVSPRGTIVVDDRMRTDHEDIFAAGDCVAQRHVLTGKEVYIPRGTTANKQGRVAGENAAGGDAIFGGIVGTAIAKLFDLTVARTGLGSAEAMAEGYDFATSVTVSPSHARSYPKPEPEPITTKLIIDRSSGRLLGAQMVGKIGVAGRIDVLATALQAGMTLDEMAALDLGYSPPFAPVWDPILVAANAGRKRMRDAEGEED